MRRQFLVLTAILVSTGFLCTVTAPLALADPSTNGPEKLEDHYLVYLVETPWKFVETMIVIDQFGAHVVNSLMLDRYDNPVDKNEEGILDPLRHHTWWLMDPPNIEPVRTVFLDNQFGPQELTVGDGQYLLLPALKNNPDDPLPNANHYECYDAEGPQMDIPVTLQDQFGFFVTNVTRPIFFCNPAEKRRGEDIYPVVEDVWLTCYELEPPPVAFESILAVDQFGAWDIDLSVAEWMCVPTQKFDAVPTENSSWSGIKARYR